jgi:hypothetical protein
MPYQRRKIIHNKYQIKEDQAYRVIIPDLHHSISTNKIKNELNEKGHLVRNIINVKHRANKEPLLLFFVDLEPQNNNKEIYQLQFLQQKYYSQTTKARKMIAQSIQCQSYGHTKTYCSKPYNCVKCREPHNTQSCKKAKHTPPTCFLCNRRHPVNYKGCMVYRDLVSARKRNNYLYECRSNVRTTLNKQQEEVSNNAQNNTLSYARAVTGVPADATSNKKHDSMDITTQLITFFSEFKNMFS